MLRWVLKKNAKIGSVQVPHTKTLNPYETNALDNTETAASLPRVIDNESLAKLNQALLASAGEKSFYSEETDETVIETLANLRADMALVERNIFKMGQVLNGIHAITQSNLAAHVARLIIIYTRPEYALALIENQSICYHIPTNDLLKLGNALINLSAHNQDKVIEATIEKVVLSFAKDPKFRKMLGCYQIMDWALQYPPLLNYVTQDLSIIMGTDAKRFDDYVWMDGLRIDMAAFCQMFSAARLLSWFQLSHVVALFVLKSNNLMDRLGVPKNEAYFNLDLNASEYLDLAEFYATDSQSANESKSHRYFEKAFELGITDEHMEFVIYQCPSLLIEYFQNEQSFATMELIRAQFKNYILSSSALSILVMKNYSLAECVGLFEEKLYLELPLDAEGYRELANIYAKHDSAQAKEIVLECTLQSLERLRLEQNPQQTLLSSEPSVQNIIFYSDSDESTDIDDDTNPFNNAQKVEGDDCQAALAVSYKNPFSRSYYELPNLPKPPIVKGTNDVGYESDTDEGDASSLLKLRKNNN